LLRIVVVWAVLILIGLTNDPPVEIGDDEL
jgi:hypothetical protein